MLPLLLLLAANRVADVTDAAAAAIVVAAVASSASAAAAAGCSACVCLCRENVSYIRWEGLKRARG